MFNDESFEKKGLMAESPKSSYCKSSRRIGLKDVANGKVPILENCRNKATVTCDNFTQMPYGERTGCEMAYCSSCLEDAKKDHVWIEIKDDDGNTIFEGCNGCQRDKGFVWNREKGGYVKRGSKKAENFASDYEDAYDEMLDEMGAAVLSQYSVSRMLKETDPIAYRVGMNDYESSLLADHQYDSDMYSEMFDEDENLTPTGEKMLKEMYDEMLDESGVEALLNNYDASRLLKETDPIAYRVGLSDYESSMEEDDRNVYRDMAMQRKGMMAETFEAKEKIDLSKSALKDRIREYERKYQDVSVDATYDTIQGIGLIDELKRCYKKAYTDDNWNDDTKDIGYYGEVIDGEGYYVYSSKIYKKKETAQRILDDYIKNMSAKKKNEIFNHGNISIVTVERNRMTGSGWHTINNDYMVENLYAETFGAEYEVIQEMHDGFQQHIASANSKSEAQEVVDTFSPKYRHYGKLKIVKKAEEMAETFGAENENMYFIFADGKEHIIAEGEEEGHYFTFTWKIPYSEIRDYVNEWTDNLWEDQEWRLNPYDVAYDFAYENWKDEPYGMNWAECVKDAVNSRIWRISEDLDEKMTKAEIRSFLTGIDERHLTKRAETFGAESSGLTRLPSDEPNFDPQKADRNKDGKISSWERTVGNKVAKGIREGRKTSSKGIDTFAEPFEDIGISKTYARLGVIAAGITALAFGVKKLRK